MDFLNNKSGSVLILSLWVLAMLLCLTFSLSYRSRIDLRLAQYEWDEIRLHQRAKKMVWQALEERKTTPVDSSQDENGRLNLNTAPAEVLKRFFGAHANVVPAILAWRTTGDIDSYSGLGYVCRHAPFKSVYELLLVQGITPEIFADVRDDLTVDTSGTVNINTASERVLGALGMTPSLVQKILSYRTRGLSFSQAASVTTALKENFFLTPDETQALAGVMQKGQIDTQSKVVHLNILAHLEDSPATCRVAVVASNGRILQWQEIRR
jgi:DNA uptake protein ComE-like DNA-binding protein